MTATGSLIKNRKGSSDLWELCMQMILPALWPCSSATRWVHSRQRLHENDDILVTLFLFFFFQVRILEPAESKSQEECGEGGEHTTLLRIGDVLRWLCEVGCIRYADPPFECWSPEMNCPDEAPNLRNKSKKHYAHKTKHGLGSIPELFMLDRHFRLDRHRGSVLYNPMMLFSRITACPSASG